MNLDADVTAFTKVSSEWTIVLNVKHEAVQLLEGHLGEVSASLGLAVPF